MKQILLLAERAFRCDAYEAVADSDHNAAVNLARWPTRTSRTVAHPAAA